LAVVVIGDCCGAFVDVLRRGPDHPVDNLPAWQCRIKAPMLITTVDMIGRRIMGKKVLPAGDTAFFCDYVLRPIRPHAPPDTMPAPPIELETTT
jgi:hypothetical protein